MPYKTNLDIALVAPSGTGKSTINKAIISLLGNSVVKNSISAATREPRPGEKDRKDYFFIEEEAFFEFAKAREFMEYNLYGSTYYGTFRYVVQNIIKTGRSVVYDVDINGAVNLRNLDPRVKIFGIRAGLETIEERLVKRGTETPQQIKRRMDIAEQELKRFAEVDFIIDYEKGAIADVAANEIVNLWQKIQTP